MISKETFKEIKEKVKGTLSKLSEGFSSPTVGLLVGLWGIGAGCYSLMALGNQSGILSFTLGCSVLVIAIVDARSRLLEKQLQDLKCLIKDSTISVPRYKRDAREPYGPNYMTDLESSVKTK